MVGGFFVAGIGDPGLGIREADSAISDELASRGGFGPPGFPEGGFPGFAPVIHPARS